MTNSTDHVSIAKFRELVELKDFKPATQKEYVRSVRRLAEHCQCDPATLTEDLKRSVAGPRHRNSTTQPYRNTSARLAGNPRSAATIAEYFSPSPMDPRGSGSRRRSSWTEPLRNQAKCLCSSS